VAARLPPLALDNLGLANKKAKILFLGLDNAGKTSLLQVLQEGRLSAKPPTQHATACACHLPEALGRRARVPTAERGVIARVWTAYLTVGKIDFHAFDLGGHDLARKVWNDYFPSCNAIIFILDAHDRERFPEAKRESVSISSPRVGGVR
jgi:GTP-binding protein SAR1